MPHMNVHDLGRLREIAAVLVRHGFGQLVRLAGLEVEGEPIHEKLPLGRRVRLVLIDLGPTFVKLGQVLSVRPDIVPAEVLDELQSLQDNVPPAPFEAVRELLEAELGATIEDTFAAFDPTPLASASIAQVHRATLMDGRHVAVKVQRPGIEPAIRSDLHILYSLAHLLSGRLEFPGLYTPIGVVQEFDAALSRELDFFQEARSATRFREYLAPHADLYAPEVVGERSTRRVLLLELLEGTRLADIPPRGQAGDAAMRKIIEATYLQVFEFGFFHGDPHPGNLLVLEDGRLAFLDFGLCGTLNSAMQDTLVHLFIGLVNRDADTVALTLYRAGATQGRVDLKAFRGEIERLMAKYHGASLRDLSESASLVEFVQVAARYRIRPVPEFAVLARAGSILDGIARRMMPDVDVVEEVRPYAERLVGNRLAPERLAGEALRLLQHAQLAIQDVPLQINQVMGDLERGSLSVQTLDPDSGLLRDEIRQAGVRVSIAVCVAALGIGGALLVAAGATSGAPTGAISVFGYLALGFSAILFSGLVLHALIAARLHPREWRRQALGVARFFLGERG